MRLKNLLLTAGLAATSLFATTPRAKATTCPNATAITSLPVTNQALVCGTADDQSATSIVQNCNGSTFYYGGLEALYTFTPATTGTYQIVYTGQTWSGIFVFSGCPSTTGTTVLACTTSSTASKTLNVNVTAGVTYYLMFDTWPSPASPCPGTFSILLPCSGTPTAGTASATVTSTCPGGTSVLSLAGQSAGPGITYQWQSSTTSATTGFTNIAGANASPYTTASLTATTYYRAIVKCTTSNDSVFTNAVTVTVAAPSTTTVNIPYSQSFENWISTCSTTDRPGTEWTTNPFNGQEAWRRDDQGASANWTTPTGGVYSPTFTLGAHSARFHSYYTSGVGSMLLNVNLSPAGPKNISFDYNNTSGTDSLYVELSTNGGTSWTVLAGLGVTSGWAVENVPTSSTSATAIIRFRAKGDFGFSTDLGMDNLNIAVVTCPQPTAVNASPVGSNTATVGWNAPSSVPGIGYRWELRTSGAAGSGATGLVNSNNVPNTQTSVSLTGLTGITSYTFYVRAVCAAGDSSVWTSVNFTTTPDCAGAPVIPSCNVLQSFSTPAGQGAWGGFIQTTTGNAPYQTPGIEKLYKFTAPTTGVYTLDVTVTNNQWVDYFVKPVAGSTCANSGWIFWDDMFGPGQDTITLIGGTQYYILADPEGPTTNTPAQTFRILCPPTCGAPITLNATTGTTTASLGWTQPAPGTPSSWQISYGTGITTAGTGTLVIATSNPFPISGLTPATNYTYYVRAICGPGDTSLWSGAFTFTTQCLPSSLPFEENFNTFLPSCWSRANGPLTTGGVLTPTTFNSWTADGYLNNGFTGAAKINLFTTGNKAWMISPTIDLGSTPSSYILEFNMAVTVWNATTSSAVLYDSLGTDDTLAVVVSYNNGATWSSANALRVFTNADDTLTSQRYYLPFTGSGQVKIGFFASDGSYGNCSSCANPADNDVFIDSVRLTQCTVPTAAILTADTLVCGSGLGITVTAAPAASYLWSTGDTTQSILVTNGGSYTLTARYGSSAGCTARDTVNIGFSPLPAVNLGPDPTVCGNISSLPLVGGTTVGTTYTYTSPVGPISGSTSTVDVVSLVNAANMMGSAATQTFQVVVTGTSLQGCVARDTVEITVTKTARVDSFQMTGTDPTFLFTPVRDSFATSYAWTFGDGGTANTATATHTYNTNGNYTVRLVVSNQCASDTATRMRMVTSDVKDAIADGTTIQLFPNPTAADAVLTVEGNAKLRGYQVLNAAGALVADRTFESGTVRATVSTDALAPGMYTLRIQLDKGVVVRKLEVLK